MQKSSGNGMKVGFTGQGQADKASAEGGSPTRTNTRRRASWDT